MAKIHAFVLDLAMVVEIGAPRIIIESYSKCAVDFISSCDNGLNEFRTFLQDVELVSQLEIIFIFVPRECNGVVDGLARHAFISSTSESWDSLFPNWLMGLVSRNH